MLIYHGSNVIVDKPRILKPNRYLDFGTGFYTTTNRAQAASFAEKVTKRHNEGASSINVYEFDHAMSREMKTLEFQYPDERWLDFVYANRIGKADNGGFDLIIGPVANDDVYQTFVLYASGILTKAQTLEALKIKKLFNQYVFVTDKSLACLKFIEAIRGMEREMNG